MEVKPGYKQTEVGVIPEDWDVAELNAVTTQIGDGLHGTPLYSMNGSYFFINGNNLSDGRIVATNETQSVEKAEFLKHKKPLGDRSILMSINGTIGNLALFDDEPVVLGKSVAFLNVLPRVSKCFIYHSLQASKVRQQFLGGLTGSTIGNLGLATIRGTKIPFPPTEVEQRAIGEALSDVDGLLGGLDRLIAKKRDLKQAAMQQLLTGQTRLPGFHGEWEVKWLGEIAKIQRGASPRPIDSPVWFDDSSPVGWVRISDVTRAGMFLLETTQRLSPLGVKHSRPVATGSLIMSICATVGRPIITQIDVCIHDGFVVFDHLEADQRFLYYVLKWIEPDWSKHGQTGSQMNLNTGLINGTRISLPPADEQTAIATVLSEMDGELAVLEQQREKTRALKQAMMQELLTGRTRLV